MGWYLRKSFGAGPVRWNLSKSGIGMSVGVRGARVGVGPRGPYVAGGRGGIYFRQNLGWRSRRPPAPPRQYVMPPAKTPIYTPPGVAPLPPPPVSAPVEHIPETNITQYIPATSDALAHYIAEQRRHVALFPWAVGVLAFMNLIMLAGYWPASIVTTLLSAVGAFYLYGWDRKRTHVALHYDLDPLESQQFGQLCSSLALLASTARLLRVEARQVHGDWKHQAGATTSLSLAPMSVLPPGNARWIESNVPVWSVIWRGGNLALRFLPDRVIVEQQRVAAAIPYPEVHINATLGRFVESSRVPPDARVIGFNWQFPNKNGGPDRRFRNNRQIPVTEAAYIALQAPSGLNLLIQASNRQRAEGFVQQMHAYKPLVCAEPPPSS